jgi:hypothetical protein
VHEDNQGVLNSATLEPGRQTPRSKFYAIRYHWFRSYMKPNEIEIVYIDTSMQKADMHGLIRTQSELSCGW